jgi:hypothetical protein
LFGERLKTVHGSRGDVPFSFNVQIELIGLIGPISVKIMKKGPFEIFPP